MIVQVYWNLHKLMWSIRNAKTGKVVSHSDYVLLESAAFRVSNAGRERVIREQRKNVHAWVQGKLVAEGPMSTATDRSSVLPYRETKEVTYNPYKYKSFVDVLSKNKVTKADFVELNGDRTVVAFNPS